METQADQFNDGMKEGLSKSDLAALSKFFRLVDEIEV